MELRDLEPKSVWRHFLTICSIPHPSHHERALALALLDWAKSKGIEASMDAEGNVAMRRAASPGKESAKGVILQAHLDMVPQKASGSPHDFERDPILPRLDPSDRSWVVATGTTLGADNGIGAAMALALLEDDTLVRGPLECLFTVNEEDGMSGARAIEPGLLSGELLLNLDGEVDSELTIGCAGAIRTAASLSYPAVPSTNDLEWFEARVEGLLGGHSGVDIDRGRANAALSLVALLANARERLLVASISGGTAANAIPREASAVVGLPRERASAFKATFAAEATAVRISLGDKDPGFSAVLAPLPPSAPRPSEALGPDGVESMLAILGALPNGLVAMEPDMPGLIRTSLNLGKLAGSASGGRFALETVVMIRSSSDPEKATLGTTVEKRLDGALDHGWVVSQKRLAESPAWSPNPASPLLGATRAVYKELFGKEPTVTSTHGGLETGLFRPRFPSWDMVSLGPTIRFPHSPDERLDIGSVERSYRFVRTLIERL